MALDPPASSTPPRRYRGVVQCDGYAPYKKVPADSITVAFCWSHLRREFFKIAERGDAPIATEAVERLGQIYAIEKHVRGTSADERRARALRVVDRDCDPFRGDSSCSLKS